ncbi:MAG: V-type ATP synthase subunit D [Negativicutes bacterium]|nr:V-type ATP synthase subunit D [Negativicutes bacterium]
MEIRVNPTRMELLRLKKRAAVAKRGHKLLKDKRDELMKTFLALTGQARDLRREVDDKLTTAYRSFLVARAVMSPEMLEEAIMFPKTKVSLTLSEKRMLNLTSPVFELHQEGEVYAYGLANTSSELDTSLGIFSEVLSLMVKLAGVERSVELLAEEIERTRRRVNALEHVLIPQLETAIKSISMKLSEQERASTTRLMKIKDLIRQ